jgi:3-dehydrosphinganine reductase
LQYDIGVHCFFPGTILSPGFEEEQKIKPQITKDIEGIDSGLTPEECAAYLLKGTIRIPTTVLNPQFV